MGRSIGVDGPTRTRGFTLIEILVVVTVIGIVLSVALLSLSVVDDDRDSRREAQRLLSLLELAQDESMMQGREFGLEFMIGSYRFVEYDPLANQWGEIIDDGTLQLRELPEEMEFNLFIEDRQILLEMDPSGIGSLEDEDSAEGIEDYVPHILIYSSGDLTPFELHLRNGIENEPIVMRLGLTGNFEFITSDDE